MAKNWWDCIWTLGILALWIYFILCLKKLSIFRSLCLRWPAGYLRGRNLEECLAPCLAHRASWAWKWWRTRLGSGQSSQAWFPPGWSMCLDKNDTIQQQRGKENTKCDYFSYMPWKFFSVSGFWEIGLYNTIRSLLMLLLKPCRIVCSVGQWLSNI